MEQLGNLNVVAQELLVTPAQLKAELPVSDQVRHKVHEAREQVRNIQRHRSSTADRRGTLLDSLTSSPPKTMRSV